MNDSLGVVSEARSEAAEFESELLRREAGRLVAVNRTLEARLALAEGDRERLRAYIKAIEHSRSWRLIQMARGWFGRQW